MKKLKISCIIFFVAYVLTFIIKVIASQYDQTYEGELVPILKFACNVEFVILAILFIIYLSKQEKKNKLVIDNKMEKLENFKDTNIITRVIYDIYKNHLILTNKLKSNMKIHYVLSINDNPIDFKLRLSYFHNSNKYNLVIGFNENQYFINKKSEKKIINDYSYDEVINLIVDEINCNKIIKNNTNINTNTNIKPKESNKLFDSFNVSISSLILFLSWFIYCVNYYVMIMIRESYEEPSNSFLSFYDKEMLIVLLVCIFLTLVSIIVCIVEMLINKRSKSIVNITHPLTIVGTIISILIFSYLILAGMEVGL